MDKERLRDMRASNQSKMIKETIALIYTSFGVLFVGMMINLFWFWAFLGILYTLAGMYLNWIVEKHERD